MEKGEFHLTCNENGDMFVIGGVVVPRKSEEDAEDPRDDCYEDEVEFYINIIEASDNKQIKFIVFQYDSSNALEKFINRGETTFHFVGNHLCIFCGE